MFCLYMSDEIESVHQIHTSFTIRALRETHETFQIMSIAEQLERQLNCAQARSNNA